MDDLLPVPNARATQPREERTMTNHLSRQFFRPVLLTAAVFFLAVSTVAAVDTVTYTYDANGRLLKANYGAGDSVTYTYDRAGNILTALSASPANTLRVFISPLGAGGVAGPNIACPGTCVYASPGSQQVTLTAVPQANFKLLAWAGDLFSTANPFTFTLDADRRITAFFGATSGSTDADGVPDADEMGPGGNDPSYDGNGDGVPDYQQANVASLPTAAGGGYVTLEVPGGQSLVGVQAVPNPHPDDAPGVKFPYGFFAFTVTGVPAAGVVVTIHLPTNPFIADYYKYGPTPESEAPHWYGFNLSGPTGAEVVQTATETRVLLHFVDTLRGDDVRTADGLIIDAGGPSVQAAPSIHLDTTILDLGVVPHGAHASGTVTVENVGDDALVIGTVGQGNPLASPFSISGDTCSGLTLQPRPAGGACQITVRFAPTTSGTFEDTFAIPSNDPTTNPVTVTVRSVGSNAEPIPALNPAGIALLVAAVFLLGCAVLRRQP